MIHLKKSFHPFLGSKMTYQTLFFLICWIILGNILSFLVDRNFYLFSPFKAFIFTILLVDVIGGAYMNTKKEVIDYYDQHPNFILPFALFHIHPFIAALLFNVSWYIPLFIYLGVVISITRVLTLVRYKRFIAFTLLFIGAFIFGWIEQGNSLSIVLFYTVFVYKLLISFGTRHYASCPINLKS